MHKWVAVKDAQEMTQVLDAKRQGLDQIIEEEQAHRPQVAALSQMQLQELEQVDTQEKEM